MMRLCGRKERSDMAKTNTYPCLEQQLDIWRRRAARQWSCAEIEKTVIGKRVLNAMAGAYANCILDLQGILNAAKKVGLERIGVVEYVTSDKWRLIPRKAKHDKKATTAKNARRSKKSHT